MRKRAARTPWHYITRFWCGSDVADEAQGRRQCETEGGKRKAGGGARGGAQEKALAVLLDLGLGQRVQVGDDGGPRGPGAAGCGGEAIIQLLLQHERQEAARHVAADRLVELMVDGPRLEQALGRAERPLHGP